MCNDIRSVERALGCRTVHALPISDFRKRNYAMTEFPPDVMVNVPSSVSLTGECTVVVRLEDHDDIAELRSAYGQRLHHVVIHEKGFKDLMWLRELSGLRVEIVFGDGSGLSSDVVDVLSTTDPLFRLDIPVRLFRNINLLASLGYPVMLNAAEAANSVDDLTQALWHYLNNALLNVAIEPFHSIMRRFLGKATHTLWYILGETVGRNVYVGEAGEVSLAQRWISAEMRFGTLSDAWKNLTETELYRRLARIRDDVSESALACVSCPHRDICGGYLRAVNPERSCEAWQKVFAQIRGKAQQVARLTESLSENSECPE